MRVSSRECNEIGKRKGKTTENEFKGCFRVRLQVERGKIFCSENGECNRAFCDKKKHTLSSQGKYLSPPCWFLWRAREWMSLENPFSGAQRW